jgi:hypothetical protein
MAATSKEMNNRCQMLVNRAVVITDEGPMGVHSREEVKDIIQVHFGISKHQFSVYHSSPELFLAIFHDAHDRDIVFAAGQVVDGFVEMGFHLWDLDRFVEREIIPYHVRISLEGIPHHAWFPKIVNKVLCDEALIHHIEEDTINVVDLRMFDCWALSKDRSRILQMVYLSLPEFEADPRRDAQVHLVRPRGTKYTHVFRVRIHIDVVEDLMFYHYPRKELIEDGRVPWKDFHWQYGRPDEDLGEDDLHPPTRFCGQQGLQPRYHPRYDEDDADNN